MLAILSPSSLSTAIASWLKLKRVAGFSYGVGGVLFRAAAVGSTERSTKLGVHETLKKADQLNQRYERPIAATCQFLYCLLYTSDAADE